MKRLIMPFFLLALFTACDQQASISKNDVEQVMDTWKQAYYLKDTALLGKVLHRDYVYSGNADGSISTRAQSMASLIDSDFSILNVSLNELDMRFYGHIAVVRGWEVLSLRLNNGDTIGVKLRFTDMYIKEDGRTQALATHSSPIE